MRGGIASVAQLNHLDWSSPVGGTYRLQLRQLEESETPAPHPPEFRPPSRQRVVVPPTRLWGAVGDRLR